YRATLPTEQPALEDLRARLRPARRVRARTPLARRRGQRARALRLARLDARPRLSQGAFEGREVLAPAAPLPARLRRLRGEVQTLHAGRDVRPAARATAVGHDARRAVAGQPARLRAPLGSADAPRRLYGRPDRGVSEAATGRAGRSRQRHVPQRRAHGRARTDKTLPTEGARHRRHDNLRRRLPKLRRRALRPARRLRHHHRPGPPALLLISVAPALARTR